MSPNETALVTNIEITSEAWQSNPLTHREWDIMQIIPGERARSVVHMTLCRLGGFYLGKCSLYYRS